MDTNNLTRTNPSNNKAHIGGLGEIICFAEQDVPLQSGDVVASHRSREVAAAAEHLKKDLMPQLRMHGKRWQHTTAAMEFAQLTAWSWMRRGRRLSCSVTRPPFS